MKKLISTMLLTLAVMTMSAAKQATPVELKEYKQATYECAYFDWWYFGNNEADGMYFGYVIFNDEGKEVAFTVMTPSETDYVTYLDGVTFKDEHEDRDIESHFYISTYWILNSLNGVRLGGETEDKEIIAKHIKEVNSSTSSMLALRSGTYYLRVYEMFIMDGSARIGSGYDQVKFTIEGVELKDLKAEVAADKKTAAISWVAPDTEDMPAGAYLYMNVSSGSETVFDNSASIKTPLNSPLTIDVQEGRTYKVVAQYVTKKMTPLGSELAMSFSVGTDEYIPKDPKAAVENDKVTFSWSADKKADAYNIIVYLDGRTYAEYTVTDAMSITKTLPTGAYTWEIAAFEKGDDGLYYPRTAYVKGNDFSTESAPLPEGTVEMNVWGMEAFLIEEEIVNNKFPWLVTLETGNAGGTGLPEVWIIVWSDRERGISGSYSSAAGNIEISETAGNGSLINTNGSQAGLITATSVEFELEFEGFDTDYAQLGYYIPYYSGSFLMTCADGKTYHGTMNQLICGTYPYSDLTVSTSSRTILSMFDEGETPIEKVEADSTKGTKRIQNGQLIIERNGIQYNVLGTVIK